MKIHSIRFKATLLYSGLLFLILLVYNAALYFEVKKMLIKDFDEKLNIKAGEISNIIKTYEEIDEIKSRPHNILESLFRMESSDSRESLIIDDLWRMEFNTLNLANDYIVIYDKAGNQIFTSGNVKDKLKNMMKKKLSETDDVYANLRGNKYNLRFISYPILYKNSLSLNIQVATPLRSINNFLEKMMVYIFISTLIILLITSFVGSVFAKRILHPVMTVTEAANNISHKDMSARIVQKELDVEMHELVNSFNSMIERLEGSFRHINEFSSNVAHELKTPLAIVRGELELAVEQLDEKDENRTVMMECLEEVDRTIKIIKDLLFIAMLEHQPKISEFEKIEIIEFIKEIGGHAEILAAEKKIAIKLYLPEKEYFINGDKVHLRRLFFNIITNAIKYTGEGEISIKAKPAAKYIDIEISDTGEGINEKDISKIFNKFYRAARKGSVAETGNGLGLSIALSIAKTHQGNIKVKSCPGEGTTFIIHLPLTGE